MDELLLREPRTGIAAPLQARTSEAFFRAETRLASEAVSRVSPQDYDVKRDNDFFIRSRRERRLGRCSRSIGVLLFEPFSFGEPAIHLGESSQCDRQGSAGLSALLARLACHR
jgi:hypothetical protein